MAPFACFQQLCIDDIKKGRPACLADFPLYPCSEPESLVSTSQPVSFEIGTGASIYTRSLLPAILKAEREVILVTCFWAPSSTLTALRETLEQLAKLREDHIRSQSSSQPASRTLPPLDISICFSSRSFFQKIFHVWSRNGYTYPPSKWVSQLGLPDPKILEAGLVNLRVKSLFFFPFSVMHPKFLIIDRRRAWLPSCNVSWESWFEGCVEITGEAVVSLLRFYHSVWDRHSEKSEQLPNADSSQQQPESIPSPSGIGVAPIQSPASHFIALRPDATPTMLLPSSHHLNPHFRPLPWLRSPSPPVTPLNCAILRLVAMAQKKIYVQTPNLTSTAAIDALLDALDRGVDVTLVTSKGMMTLEQILTAGSTTSWRLRSFISLYEKREKHSARSESTSREVSNRDVLDLEAQLPRLGTLEIFLFHPLPADQSQQALEEPVHSHLKLMTVDDEYIVLGSGNMDRASWFTSQELGILLKSDELVANISSVVSHALEGRLSLHFSSKRSGCIGS
ncbi:hypothetical protein GGR50DRAFT_72511 [Xylaria sp. CBS 124048]|nr:hypothetical protein GGR50DRAFT_72511 [Xylaria sp. CBS 124048]